MKKILALILAFTMVFALCAFSSSSGSGQASYTPVSERKWQEYTVGDYKIKVFDATRDAAIVDYNGSDTEVVVPAELDGYPVTAIGEMAFYYSSYSAEKLLKVTLPDSVTAIEESAFRGQTELKEFKIPSGVTYLGESVFYGCESLTALAIPEGITVIPAYLCYECTALRSVTLPSGVTNIGERAFASCSLKSITLPEGLVQIEKFAFYENELTEVTFPSTLTTLGESAFSSNDNMVKMVIPETVKKIGDYAIPRGVSGEMEIWCAEGSAAYKYATKNGIKYRLT